VLPCVFLSGPLLALERARNVDAPGISCLSPFGQPDGAVWVCTRAGALKAREIVRELQMGVAQAPFDAAPAQIIRHTVDREQGRSRPHTEALRQSNGGRDRRYLLLRARDVDAIALLEEVIERIGGFAILPQARKQGLR